MNMINSAIHYLTQKSHSEGELYYLLENHYRALPNLDKALEETMKYLVEHGLVHDGRLAQDIARHYAHKGNQFIRNVLAQRKIRTERIEEALEALPTEDIRAWEEVHLKLRALGRHSENEQTNVLVRFLAGRQFSGQVINDTINKINSRTIYKIEQTSTYGWSKAS